MPSSIIEEEEEFYETIRLASQFPSEILLDILLRLPIKTLSRLKSLSKRWNSTIINPRFGIRYTTNQNVTNKKTFSCLIVSFREQRDYGKHVHYLADHERFDSLQTAITFYTPNLPQPVPEEIFCCNGLILSGGHDPYTLSNPITGAHVQVPRSWTQDSGYAKYITSGLGYCPTSKAFKIVRIMKIYNGELRRWETFAEVFNCSKREWRVTYRISSIVPQGGRNILVNGALYWKVWDDEFHHRHSFILSFQLDNERFYMVPLPRYVGYFELLMLGECLCLVDTVHHDHIEIWVMKEYGLKSSWVKEYIISDIVLDGNCVKGPYQPINTLQNGEMLILCCNKYMGYYNFQTKGFRTIDIRGITNQHELIDMRHSVHVSSLISVEIPSLGCEIP